MRHLEIPRYLQIPTLAPGQEQFFIHYTSTINLKPHRVFLHYEYCASNGEVFSCRQPTLEECRAERDAWLKKQIQKKC